MLKKRLLEMKNLQAINFDKGIEVISMTESELINGSCGKLKECGTNTDPVCPKLVSCGKNGLL